MMKRKPNKAVEHYAADAARFTADVRQTTLDHNYT